MRLVRTGLLILALAASALASDVAGKWNVTANAPDGNVYKVILAVSEEGGKLSGVLDSERGTMPLRNVVYENNELRFDLVLDMGAIPFKLKVDGDTLKGTLTAPDGTAGTVTGERLQPAPSSTPSFTGKWNLVARGPDHGEMRATLELKQDGGRLAGQVMPETGETFPLTDLQTDGNAFRAKVQAGNGAIEISGKVTGGEMVGQFIMPDGGKGSFTGRNSAAAVPSAPVAIDGKWKVVARDAEGIQLRSTLKLKLEGGRLTGQIVTDNGDVAPLIDGKLQGSEFSFKIYAGDGNIEVTGKMEGAQLSGEYKTPNGSKGTYTASRE